jgi:hypothetical protein
LSGSLKTLQYAKTCVDAYNYFIIIRADGSEMVFKPKIRISVFCPKGDDDKTKIALCLG